MCRRSAPAACSSVAQTFWTHSVVSMNRVLARDVLKNVNVTMLRLRGQTAFKVVLLGGGRNELDDPLTFKKSSNILLETSAKNRLFADFIKNQKLRSRARQLAIFEPLSVFFFTFNKTSEIALSLETSSKFR